MVALLDLQLTDSAFLRSTGGLFFFCDETQQRHISNVTFQVQFLLVGVLNVYSSIP